MIWDARVAVGACTFRRPQGVQNLLSALADQHLDPSLGVMSVIIIVDNDKTPSAAARVAPFDNRPFPIIYRHEPKRGLTHARNRLLAEVPASVRWFAFIDDDEVPVPGWLNSLLATARSTGAPIVAGPVEPIFAASPPAWIREGGFFGRASEPDGTPTKWISTQNALVDMDMIRRENWRFDLEFNVSGGEDEHFFLRALDRGYGAVMSSGALVHDHVPVERAAFGWLWHRHLRMGMTLARIDLKRLPAWQALPLRLAKSAVRLAIGLARIGTSPLLGRTVLVRGALDVARAAGAVLGLAGKRKMLYG